MIMLMRWVQLSAVVGVMNEVCGSFVILIISRKPNVKCDGFLSNNQKHRGAIVANFSALK